MVFERICFKTHGPNLSTSPYILSKPALLPDFAFPHILGALEVVAHMLRSAFLPRNGAVCTVWKASRGGTECICTEESATAARQVIY